MFGIQLMQRRLLAFEKDTKMPGVTSNPNIVRFAPVSQ